MMSKWLGLGVVLALATATQIVANPIPWGGIQPSSNMTGEGHYLYDAPARMLPVYVVAVDLPWQGGTACSFSAPKPGCFTASYLSDTTPFTITNGNSQTGVYIHFGACLVEPVWLLTVNYLTFGTTAECCWYWVQPHPSAASGSVEVVDCYGEVHLWYGGPAIVNPDAKTLCGTIPVEGTTWGGVKALFAD